MTGPEVMRAFQDWRKRECARCEGCRKLSLLASAHTCTRLQLGEDAYPLYIGCPTDGRWYVRERAPGTRIWRAEEDGSFTLLGNPPALARREIAGRVF